MNIAILGTKGAGKGTQVAKLIQEFNLRHFSPGEALRQAAKDKTPLSQIAEACLRSGQLVPDDIVNAMVEEWLRRITAQQGIAFDGFPRTIQQADFTESAFAVFNRKLDAVVHIKVSEETVIKRLSRRRRCWSCKEDFHIGSAPFHVCPHGKCEGQHLKCLDEDRPQIVGMLVNLFHRGMEPLFDYYRKKGQLMEIDGEGSADEVHALILKAIGQCSVPGKP